MKTHLLAKNQVRCFLAAVFVVPSLALAQAPEPETIKTDYKLAYRSALSEYEPYKEQSVQSWKEANDKVGEIGGWRAYAKEIRQAEPATQSDQPAPGHDAAHGGKK